jgi:mRNA-degrading endonuclease RelE of RelBE toxin-antitoxin system
VKTNIFRENFCENENFSRKLLRKRKLSRNEISQKLAHYRLIFAFRENEKTVVVSTLLTGNLEISQFFPEIP